MAFTTPIVGGGTATLGHLDKFLIDGEPLVITGLGSHGTGLRTRREPPAAVPKTYYPFTGLNPVTLAPTWGAAVTIRVQLKTLGTGQTGASQQLLPEDGPDMPLTRKKGYLLEANAGTDYPHVQIELWDLVHGLMIPDLYAVNLIPPPVVTGAGDPELSIPPTTTPAAAVTLTVRKVDLREQWVFEGNSRRKVGDALIVVSREGLNLDSLLADGAFIEVGAVGVNGGTARKYQMTGPDGITPLVTFDWSIYLQRVGV